MKWANFLMPGEKASSNQFRATAKLGQKVVSDSLTCEVHDGASKLKLAGVVDLEPVGDRRIAETPSHSSPVASDLEAMDPSWLKKIYESMGVQQLPEFPSRSSPRLSSRACLVCRPSVHKRT